MGKWGLSRKRDSVLNSGYIFENGKPDIVLKTVNRFTIKSLKLGIVVLVKFNKMLVIVLLSTFTLDMGPDPKNPVF